jgi:DNA polymerase-3 subunit gamma/tau
MEGTAAEALPVSALVNETVAEPRKSEVDASQPRTDSAPISAPTADILRDAVAAALDAGGHPSAAQLLGAGVWTLDTASVRIEVAGMGKKMLSITVNAAAEKIIRQELQRLGAPARFLVVLGEGDAPAAAPVAAPGSAREAALKHPMVQRAREIFQAEIRSVVDLREK